MTQLSVVVICLVCPVVPSSVIQFTHLFIPHLAPPAPAFHPLTFKVNEQWPASKGRLASDILSGGGGGQL